MNPKQLAQYIDHTQLEATATSKDIRKLCDEAITYGFHSVCIQPMYVKEASAWLSASPVKVCTVIGFPLGANSADVKAQEAKVAIRDGADELDFVIPVGALLEGRWDEVKAHMQAVAASKQDGILLKAILETCYLTDAQIVAACQLAKESGIDFVKTSTGFGAGGATTHHVKLMRQTVGDVMGVKASGGIRTYHDALTMIEAGASRIGASKSVQIMEEVTT